MLRSFQAEAAPWLCRWFAVVCSWASFVLSCFFGFRLSLLGLSFRSWLVGLVVGVFRLASGGFQGPPLWGSPPPCGGGLGGCLPPPCSSWDLSPCCPVPVLVLSVRLALLGPLPVVVPLGLRFSVVVSCLPFLCGLQLGLVPSLSPCNVPLRKKKKKKNPEVLGVDIRRGLRWEAGTAAEAGVHGRCTRGSASAMAPWHPPVAGCICCCCC